MSADKPLPGLPSPPDPVGPGNDADHFTWFDPHAARLAAWQEEERRYYERRDAEREIADLRLKLNYYRGAADAHEKTLQNIARSIPWPGLPPITITKEQYDQQIAPRPADRT